MFDIGGKKQANLLKELSLRNDLIRISEDESRLNNKRIDELNLEKNNLSSRLESALEEIAKLSNELDEARSEKNELIIDLEISQKSLALSIAEAEKLHVLESSLSERSSDYQNSLNSLNEALAKLKIENQEKEQAIQKLKAAQSNLEKSSSKKILEHENNLNSLNDELLKVKAENLEKDRAIQKLKAAQFSLEKSSKQYAIEIEAINSELGNRISDLNVIQPKLDHAILENKLSNEKLSTLLAENSALNKKVDEISIELSKEKLKNEELIALQERQKNELSGNNLSQLLLDQARSELNEYYFKYSELTKTAQQLKSSLARIRRENPSLVDFGILKITSVDSISEIPSVTWRLSDYSDGDGEFEPFAFKTLLRNGVSGISILDSIDGSSTLASFEPKFFRRSPLDLDNFKSIKLSDWRKMLAAIAALRVLIGKKAIGFNLSEEFDYGFWSNSLISLAEDFKSLPSMLRYDSVKLKRELQNPDYEHLWLEFHNLEFGDHKSARFELRVGAAMVNKEKFSQQPKLEFPLIDGKFKPFESWYIDSYDDYGEKFELRFLLDKKVYDINALMKLSNSDQLLITALIGILPSALMRLSKEKVAIRRPWDVWINFTQGLLDVFVMKTPVIKNEQPSAVSPSKAMPEFDEVPMLKVEKLPLRGKLPTVQVIKKNVSKKPGLTASSPKKTRV